MKNPWQVADLQRLFPLSTVFVDNCGDKPVGQAEKSRSDAARAGLPFLEAIAQAYMNQ
jgi:hypothetical protein